METTINERTLVIKDTYKRIVKYSIDFILIWENTELSGTLSRYSPDEWDFTWHEVLPKSFEEWLDEGFSETKLANLIEGKN